MVELKKLRWGDCLFPEITYALRNTKNKNHFFK